MPICPAILSVLHSYAFTHLEAATIAEHHTGGKAFYIDMATLVNVLCIVFKGKVNDGTHADVAAVVNEVHFVADAVAAFDQGSTQKGEGLRHQCFPRIQN